MAINRDPDRLRLIMMSFMYIRQKFKYLCIDLHLHTIPHLTHIYNLIYTFLLGETKDFFYHWIDNNF